MSSKVLESWKVSTRLKSSMVLRQWFIHQREFLWRSRGKLKEQLDRLQSLGIIEQVTDPTPWVSSLVTVLKPNGQIRVCIDSRDLNRVLRRSHYPTPAIDEILPKLSRAKEFSNVDAKNGLWHVELDDGISRLTTFR